MMNNTIGPDRFCRPSGTDDDSGSLPVAEATGFILCSLREHDNALRFRIRWVEGKRKDLIVADVYGTLHPPTGKGAVTKWGPAGGGLPHPANRRKLRSSGLVFNQQAIDALSVPRLRRSLVPE